MTAKLTASADGSKVLIGTAAEDALQIDATTKTVKALSPYTLAGNGPAFSAYATAATPIPNGVATVIPLLGKNFDTNNCHSAVTGRFTPNVAGYYRVDVVLSINTTDANKTFSANILKNGSGVTAGPAARAGTDIVAIAVASALVYMNGTTDYVECSIYNNNGEAYAINNSGISRNTFSAFLARAA